MDICLVRTASCRGTKFCSLAQIVLLTIGSSDESALTVYYTSPMTGL